MLSSSGQIPSASFLAASKSNGPTPCSAAICARVLGGLINSAIGAEQYRESFQLQSACWSPAMFDLGLQSLKIFFYSHKKTHQASCLVGFQTPLVWLSLSYDLTRMQVATSPDLSLIDLGIRDDG